MRLVESPCCLCILPNFSSFKLSVSDQRKQEISPSQKFLLAYFPYFENIKGGLCAHLAVCVFLAQFLKARSRPIYVTSYPSAEITPPSTVPLFLAYYLRVSVSLYVYIPYR